MEIAQYLVDKWEWLTGLGAVVIVAMLLDICFNSARRSLSRLLFQRLKVGKDRYDRWKEWLQADYHPGLAEIKKYFVDRPYARDLPREKVVRLSQNTAVLDGDSIEEWPQDWPETTGQTLAANFISKRGRWLRGKYQRTGNSLPEVHLIVGNGGMGKSALLSYLFVRVAQNWRNFLPLIANHPIYLHHLRSELLPWEPGGSLHSIPDHDFSGAVLLFDELGMNQRSGTTAPSSVIRSALAQYPQARCLVFAGRATNLLPYWQGIEKLQAADDVRLVCHHLLPFRPEEEARRFIQQRFSRWGGQRKQAQQLVNANPIFERPLFLSYLPMCLGEVFAFSRESWDHFDWSNTGGEQPSASLGDVLTEHFRRGYYDKRAWKDLKVSLVPRLNEKERKWLASQSPFLFDRIFQVTGPGQQIKGKQSPFSQAGNLLQLMVDQWLYREIRRPEQGAFNLDRAEDVHAFCRRWVVEQFRINPAQLLAPFPWSLRAAKPKQGFGSVLARVWDIDPANNLYRFAHRSVAEYFLAEAILRQEVTLDEAILAEQEQAVQMTFELYASSPKGLRSAREIRLQAGRPLHDVQEYAIPFSAFDPFPLSLLPNLRQFCLTEGNRTLLELQLTPSSPAWQQVLQKLRKRTELKLSGLELEDDDLDALLFFPSLSELNLSANSLVSPPLHNYLGQLKQLNLWSNPLSEDTYTMLIEHSCTEPAYILLNYNDFTSKQILRLLAQPGVHDLSLKNYFNYNKTPFAYLYACELGEASIPWLSSHKTVLNAKNLMGRTALMFACEYNDVKTLRYLLEAKANIEQQDINKLTPLLIACQHSDTETVRYLIEAKANIDQQTKDGWTPLMIACQYNSAKTVKYLIDAKANIDQQNIDGVTALRIACQHNNVETIKYLIEAKANIEQQDMNGWWTPLMLACKYNSAETVKYLIEAKANIDQQDQNGWTPLMLACQYNDAETVKGLIEAKANINHINNEGASPLLIACLYNDREAVRALIEAGADLDQRSKGAGRTILMHLAARETEYLTDQHINFLTLLDTGRIDLFAEDTQGFTALEAAKFYQRHHNARALRAAQNGTFDYDQLLAEWEQYKTAAGIVIPSTAERIRLKREEDLKKAKFNSGL